MSGPTEPVPPVDPRVPREPIARERVRGEAYETAYPADAAWWARIDDRLRTLTTMLALVGIVALGALGLAVYALVHDRPSRSGASEARVSALADRVSRVEDRTSGAASSATTSNLAGRLSQKANKEDVQKLADQVSQLRGTGTSADVARLSARVDQLAKQVATLQGTSGGTTTSP
jgi:hypothetical protein